MSVLETAGLRALRLIDPERAHAIALHALRLGLGPSPGPITSGLLRTELAGLSLPNPLGLAAGFDKNAVALGPLSRSGLGFIEVGAATPRPQEGNPRPRLFRLPQDRAVINRFGFNNEGMDAIAARLRRGPSQPPIGVNLGANKDSPDRAADFAQVLECCGPHVDFATVNVSSPNTERLRDLQGAEALGALLRDVRAVRDRLTRRPRVFLKIAPDLDEAQIADIAALALATGIDGIIATNTTLDRTGLSSPYRSETGGLSGRPLFERSTRVLALLSERTEGRLPLIGVGGVSNAEDLYAKIRAGATAVQLYTALAYEGFSLVPRLLAGLEELLARDGFADVASAVGSERGRWL